MTHGKLSRGSERSDQHLRSWEGVGVGRGLSGRELAPGAVEEAEAMTQVAWPWLGARLRG